MQILPSADERLEAEQQRVGSLENIVGQLEERMSELSQAAMAAPGISALELGGPAAELVVASNALRKEWKAATTELTTTRHILASLELEYKDARKQLSWGCWGRGGGNWDGEMVSPKPSMLMWVEGIIFLRMYQYSVT